MEVLRYDGLIEQWKVDLIVTRAQRMGFRWDEVPDLQQRIVVDLLAFRFDSGKSNGAQVATALCTIIDNNLKTVLRRADRYQSHLGMLARVRPLMTDLAAEECAIDIRLAVADLPWRDRAVCIALAEGYSRHEIAQRLRCGWHTVNRLVLRIRDRFREIDLDCYSGADASGESSGRG